MGWSVSITYHPENLFVRWEWRVKDKGFSEISMRDPWASVMSDQRYGFGFNFTKHGAERAARGWIKRYLKNQAKYGEKPMPETIEIEV